MKILTFQQFSVKAKIGLTLCQTRNTIAVIQISAIERLMSAREVCSSGQNVASKIENNRREINNFACAVGNLITYLSIQKRGRIFLNKFFSLTESFVSDKLRDF